MKIYIYVIMLLLVRYTSIAQTIYTPNGSQVPQNSIGTYPEEEFVLKTCDYQLQDLQDAVSNGLFGSSCVVIGGYSRQYNCHGYAWHVSTGGSQTAIFQYIDYGNYIENTYAVEAYVAGNNPSYTQTSYNNQGGLRVRYGGDHSAVTTYYPGLYLSKWGAGPLVRHSANDVPYGYGSPSTYWSCNYTPPLTSITLDYNSVPNFSAFPVSWGTHTLGISYGLTPDTPPYFQTTASSTVVNSQNGNSVNFTFSGSNNGGMAVQMCGANRYSFIFYKPSGWRIAVYPNPSEDETTVELQSSNEEQYLVPVIDNKDSNVKIDDIILFDEFNNIKKSYKDILAESNKTSIRFDKNLKGNYYLKVIFSDGTSQTKRIKIGN
jgi:hypothetical protein